MATGAISSPQQKAGMSLQERLRPSLRRRIRRSPLTYMLLLSLFLHLSMVTIFKIMVYFPYDETHYYSFRIAQDKAPATLEASGATAETFSYPASERLRISGFQGAGYRLPEIDLPTVELAEHKRLRLAREGLKATSLYDSLISEEPSDSWERFGRGMHRLGESILKLAGGTNPLWAAPDASRPQAVPARVGLGYEAEIIWASDPRDRALLFSPPIPALQQLKAGTLEGPLSFNLRVNAQGKVTSALCPPGPVEVIDEIQKKLLQFRFEPLDLPTTTTESSMGTLYIWEREDAENG